MRRTTLELPMVSGSHVGTGTTLLVGALVALALVLTPLMLRRSTVAEACSIDECSARLGSPTVGEQARCLRCVSQGAFCFRPDHTPDGECRSAVRR